jgi:hypothetical protein
MREARVARHNSLIWSVSAALALHGLAAESASLTLAVSNPYCAASQPELNRCSINIRSISAVASDTSFSRVEIAVDGKLRAVENGFFETSAYFASTMLPGGLSVTCGLDGEGGAAGFGRNHTVAVSAYLSGSGPLADTATVTCPPASDRIFADGYEPGVAGY